MNNKKCSKEKENEGQGYKNADVDMVIFETYASGIVGSSDVKGFLYLEQEMTEDG